METPQISIVAPLYNETASFPHLIARLNKLMDAQPLTIEVVLIDDGSRDDTPILMRQLALFDARYHCVFLSRNYGHQLALSAGLAAARAKFNDAWGIAIDGLGNILVARHIQPS
ncbi:MAG: glycosyltransferase, partial [Nostocaceae cyanobacterium CSU_2_110]|nr:glycosyltransferase [Nostocaceae cyanobacterium CSU_2_110]